MFGIRCIIFEPGYFRTKAWSPESIKHDTLRIPDYAKLNKASLAYEAAAYGNVPGDPKKAVERMIDVVKGQGFAKGMAMPLRLTLGRDGLQVVRDKCEETLKTCEAWEELIMSTDVDIE